MKVVIQRVKHASVKVDGAPYSEIGVGFLLLVGITHEDSSAIVHKMADKICGLRIFDDPDDKMNYSLSDVQGEILSVSQFTLYADCKKGRRPSFEKAARPQFANALYNEFNEVLSSHGVIVKTGKFQAEMQVNLINDGPVTIVLDSNQL